MQPGGWSWSPCSKSAALLLGPPPLPPQPSLSYLNTQPAELNLDHAPLSPPTTRRSLRPLSCYSCNSHYAAVTTAPILLQLQQPCLHPQQQRP